MVYLFSLQAQDSTSPTLRYDETCILFIQTQSSITRSSVWRVKRDWKNTTYARLMYNMYMNMYRQHSHVETTNSLQSFGAQNQKMTFAELIEDAEEQVKSEVTSD